MNFNSGVLEELPDPKCYLETPAFQQYVNRVGEVIAKRPATIGDVLRKVGRDRIEWLADALEALKVEEIGVLPTRYKLVTYTAKDLSGEIRKWNV